MIASALSCRLDLVVRPSDSKGFMAHLFSRPTAFYSASRILPLAIVYAHAVVIA